MGRHAHTPPPGRRRSWLAAGAVALTGATALGAATASTASAAGIERSDFDGNGASDLAVGVPKASSSAGSVTVLPGSASGPSTAAKKIVTQNSGSVPGSSESGDRFGAATASGDVDGDGRLDLVVGAPGEDDTQGNRDRGSVTILTGSSGLTSGTSFTTGGTVKTPELAQLGSAVAVGDFDNDGKDDIYTAGLGGGGNGGWEIYRDSATRTLEFHTLDTADLTHVDAVSGDFNADGYDDVAVTFVNEHGRAVVREHTGSADGLVNGYRVSDVAGGRSVDAADINGDGHDDLVVGQPYAAESGARAGGQVTVKLGATSGLQYGHTPTTVHQDTAGVPGAAEAGDAMGASVALRDVDGDGTPDIVTGLPGEDLSTSTDAGSALVIRIGATPDPASITVAGAQSLTQGAGGIGGAPESGDRFGTAVAGGDFTGTDVTSLAIGAAGENSADGTIVHRTQDGTASYLGRSALGSAAGAGLGGVLAP